MRKIILSVLVALITALTLAFAGMFVAAEDADTPVITVDQKSVRAGSTVKIAVSIKNNPGILGMTLKLAYDDALVLTNIESGDAMSNHTFTPPGDFHSDISLPWDAEKIAPEDVKDGIVVTLTFKVRDNAEVGKNAGVTISYVTGAIIDDDLKPVFIEVISGGVEIIDYIPGDVNDDGEVNSTDAVYLRRFIAGGYGVTINEKAADVNADNDINTTDVVYIRRFVAGGYGIVLMPSHTHTAGEPAIENEIKPTCETDGSYDAVVYCSDCGFEMSRETVINAGGHIYDLTAPAATSTPSCTKYGFWFYACGVCGHPSNATGDTGATNAPIPSTAPAGSEWVCNGVLKLPKLAHKFTVYVPYKGAEGYESGNLAHYLCQICSAVSLDAVNECSVSDVTIPGAERPRCPGADAEHYMTNCTTVFVKTVAPKCGVSGYDLYECTTCRAPVLTNWTELGDGEHKWDPAMTVITTPPTCTNEGMALDWCIYCDTYVSHKVDALNHTYLETGETSLHRVTTLPTCDKTSTIFDGIEGYITEKCYQCDYSVKVQDLEFEHDNAEHHPASVLNEDTVWHNGVEYADAAAADAAAVAEGATEANGIYWPGSCDNPKLVDYYCPTCERQFYAADHSMVGDHAPEAGSEVAYKAPDCENAGNYAHYVCEKCDKKVLINADGDKFVYSDDAAVIIPATGHNYQWVISSPDDTYESYMCVAGNGSAGCGHVKDTREAEYDKPGNWVTID